MGWIDLLKGKVVGFDTMPLIYYMGAYHIVGPKIEKDY